MRYLQALAVVVFAATLVMASGCEPEKPVAGASKGDTADAAQLQKDLGQAKVDLKAAQGELATKGNELATQRNELAAKTTEVQNLKKQLDAANAKLADIQKSVQDAMKLAAPTMAAPMAPETSPGK
jgi:uncharacterized protein (DUF3084 family)